MNIPKIPRLYTLGLRYPKTVLSLSLLVAVISIMAARKLSLESNLYNLLPEHMESVQNLRDFKKYFGLAGDYVVTVESDQPELSERFADQLAAKIEKMPSVLYVDYRRPVDYFKKRFWLYLDRADLLTMEKRTERALELQKKGVSVVFNDIMDFADPEDRPDLTFKDILEKYSKDTSMPLKDYLSDTEGRLVVFRVKTEDQEGDLGAIRGFLATMQAIERDLKKDVGFAAIRVGYTGDNETMLEETEQTQREMVRVSLIVFVLIVFVVLLYFRRIEAVFLVGVPVAMGVVWTGGLSALLMGHLNIMTSFAAAILAGVGSDYGIYLLTRYYLERAAGVDFEKACELAFVNTGRATYACMVTTVGGFAALLFSNFRVFFEFGVIGAVGFIANYAAMVLLIPAFLALTDRKKDWRGIPAFREWHILTKKPVVAGVRNLRWPFVPRKAAAGVIVAAVLCGLAATTIPSESKIYFKGDMMAHKNLRGNLLYNRVLDVLDTSLRPTILMVRGLEEEQRTIDVLNSRLEDPGSSAKNLYKRVVGISTFVPREQGEKRPILAGLLSKFRKIHITLKEKEDFLKSLDETIHSEPVTRERLPPEILRTFLSNRQKDYSSIFFFPAFLWTTSDSLKAYQRGVYDLKKETGLNFQAVDVTFAANDIVQLVEKEAPRGLLMILVFLALVLLFLLRSVRRSLIIMLHLIGSLILLSGVMRILGMQLNILNASIIPVILGTGIDCFIHFNHRYEENKNMTETMKLQAPSIFISNLTSVVGFGGLIFTGSTGLQSVGWVSVIGLAIVTILCLFVFPRVLALESRR